MPIALTSLRFGTGGWSLSSHGFAPWSQPADLLGVNLAVLQALPLGRRLAARNT